MNKLKNIFAVFWITVLFFALSGRTVHVFLEDEHEHEFVCSEKSTHIHEKEHECFICDFELQLADGFQYHVPSFDYVLPQETNTFITNVFVSTHSKFNFSLRGPPAV